MLIEVIAINKPVNNVRNVCIFMVLLCSVEADLEFAPWILYFLFRNSFKSQGNYILVSFIIFPIISESAVCLTDKSRHDHINHFSALIMLDCISVSNESLLYRSL